MNFSYSMLKGLVSFAHDNNIRPPELNTMGLFASIVSPGELRAVTRPNGGASEDDIRPLADFLGDYLPPSVHQTLSVPTLPLVMHADKRRANRRFVTIATANPTIQSERIAAQSLIRACFRSPAIQFPDNSHLGHPHMGRFTNDKGAVATTAFREFLDRHPDLLPTETVLGAACIEIIHPELEEGGPAAPPIQ